MAIQLRGLSDGETGQLGGSRDRAGGEGVGGGVDAQPPIWLNLSEGSASFLPMMSYHGDGCKGRRICLSEDVRALSRLCWRNLLFSAWISPRKARGKGAR